MAGNWGASVGHEATGSGLQSWGVRRRSRVGEIQPGGETNLSEVMLIFRAGEKRVDVPRRDSSSDLHSCA